MDCFEMVSVLTYNINYGLVPPRAGKRAGPKFAEVMRAITATSADIVALQETTARHEAYLRVHLAALYPHQHWIGATERLSGGSALLVKSHLAIEAVEALPLPDTVEGSVFAQMIALVALGGGRRVALANLHLRPPLALHGGWLTTPTTDVVAAGGGLRGALAHAHAYMHTAGAVHQRELDAVVAGLERLAQLPRAGGGEGGAASTATTATPVLAEWAAAVASGDGGGATKVVTQVATPAAAAAPPPTSTTPLLIVGDFNEGHYGSGVKSMVARGFVDAATNAVTWHWTVGKRGSIFSTELSGSYDHLFYRPLTVAGKREAGKDGGGGRLEVVRCEVLTEFKGASDHLPVFGVFGYGGGEL